MPKRRPASRPRKGPRAENRPAGPAPRPTRNRPRVSVFIGASVDGFIARETGDLDWLEVPGDPRGEDYGYKAFVGQIDAVVMGRKTFEKALSFGDWSFGKTPVFVLSTRPLQVPPDLRRTVETMADRPTEIVGRLAKRGLHRLYLDGGHTIQGFLRAGLVDELTITRVPVLLGKGVPLFGALPSDVRLKHLETRTFRSGLVQSTYAVRRERKRERRWKAVAESARAKNDIALADDGPGAAASPAESRTEGQTGSPRARDKGSASAWLSLLEKVPFERPTESMERASLRRDKEVPAAPPEEEPPGRRGVAEERGGGAADQPPVVVPDAPAPEVHGEPAGLPTATVEVEPPVSAPGPAVGRTDAADSSLSDPGPPDRQKHQAASPITDPDPAAGSIDEAE